MPQSVLEYERLEVERLDELEPQRNPEEELDEEERKLEPDEELVDGRLVVVGRLKLDEPPMRPPLRCASASGANSVASAINSAAVRGA
jgi:hypothetical protein